MIPDHQMHYRRDEGGRDVPAHRFYAGFAIYVGADAPKVLDSASTSRCALARLTGYARPRVTAGDTLLHPGPIGGADLVA